MVLPPSRLAGPWAVGEYFVGVNTETLIELLLRARRAIRAYGRSLWLTRLPGVRPWW
jgi:hypothetical protein